MTHVHITPGEPTLYECDCEDIEMYAWMLLEYAEAAYQLAVQVEEFQGEIAAAEDWSNENREL